MIPEADALVGRNPMYALSDLRPIARYTADPTVLAVRADAPWQSVNDFVEDARKRPGAINYGCRAATEPCMCPWKYWRRSRA